MLTKEEVLKSFQELPDKFEIDEAIERLELLEAIRVGIEQADNGQTYTIEEVREHLSKWLK